MTSTYLGYQLYANNLSKSLANVASETSVANARAYYDANIGKVKTVDQFIGNYRLFSYAMKAAGLEDMTSAKAFMRKVLTSDLSDSTSFVNKLTDPRFRVFATSFSFGSTGASASTAAAQNATQEARTVALYTNKVGTDSIASVLSTAYYEAHIGAVKSIKDLMGDSQLLDYVTTAYGIDANQLENGTLAESTNAANDLQAVLESDASDPNSAAAQMARGDADTSNVPVALQTAVQQDATSQAYTKAYGRTNDLIYYENQIGKVHSIDVFLADPTLVTVAEKAFGIDGKGYSNTDLKRILTSALDDPMSVANQLGPATVAFAKAFNLTQSATSPYMALAQDFNFDSTGAVSTVRTAQSTVNIVAAETLYQTQAKSDAASQAQAKADATAYGSAISGITTLDDLLGNAKITSFIETAYGLPGSTSTDTLRSILTSDLSDPKSAANKGGSTTRKLAAAFNFSKTGAIERTGGTAQTAKSVQMLDDGYLQQMLEDDAEQDNEGVKLALYFQQKAPSITSVYSILADPALLKVVQTALNIPAQTSGQDIDTQATRLKQRLNVADFRNPAKLRSFIAQFANLYDLANLSASGDDSVTSLLGQSQS